jgi:hypothetical protein
MLKWEKPEIIAVFDEACLESDDFWGDWTYTMWGK